MNNVQEAIAFVMSKVPYVKKTYSDDLGYGYTSESELIRLLHPAMVEAGLTFMPSETTVLESGTYKTKSGTEMRRVMVHVRYKLHHVPSKTEEFVEAPGEASDSSDKATAKAMTMAHKTGMRQAFNIESGERDPDADRPELPECPWSEAMLSHFAQIGMLPKDKLERWLKRIPQAAFSPEEQTELTKRITERLAAIDKGRNREPLG